MDPYGSLDPDQDEEDEAAEEAALEARGISKNELAPRNSFDKRQRGGRRPFDITIDYLGQVYIITILARGYPGSSRLHDEQSNPRAVAPSDTIYTYVPANFCFKCFFLVILYLSLHFTTVSPGNQLQY